MAEPLKNIYSPTFIRSLAEQCKIQYTKFNADCFINSVVDGNWESRALKERMQHTAMILGQHLPQNYVEAIAILLPVSDKFSGLAHMLFADYVAQYGLDNVQISMDALEYLTEGSSAEFAIRPFIIQYPQETMSKMELWSHSSNKHVRRLASEGCRPRLPWAVSLPEFKRNPDKILHIILKLIDDESLYVRRSVANNLNDISKDHPERVVKLAQQYIGQSQRADWVFKHACRGLLKKGNIAALKLFGFNSAPHVLIKNFVVAASVSWGKKINFEFELHSTNVKLGKLRIEYSIGFVKANEKISTKVFKISEGNYCQYEKKIQKYFSFKAISTRKYYPGIHRLAIVVNGNEIASKEFALCQR